MLARSRFPLVIGLLLLVSPADLRAQKPPAAPAARPVPLNKKGTVFLDKPRKRLLLKTRVVLREGILEMFCCRRNTKEHESILAVDSPAYIVHAGLLALGVKPGTPAKFDPKFVAPTGQEMQIFVTWNDKKGKPHRVDARTWMRYATRRYFAYTLKRLPAGFKFPDERKSPLRYDKRTKELLWFGHMTTDQRKELLKLSADKDYRAAIASFFKRTQYRQMDVKWVFAGSLFVVDPKTMKSRYLAEEGTLICVANFPGATIDVTVRSSADAGSEMFEAWTERIPKEGTDVTVEIIPVARKKPAAAKRGNKGGSE